MPMQAVKRRGKRSAHRPPARVRYEESHPVVSCRLSKDEYDLLKQRLEDLGGVSFADFLKDALGVIKVDMGNVNRIREVAHEAGYEQGKKDHRIWYPCHVCRRPMYVTPRDESHKAIVRLLRKERWGHGACHQR